ncbi:MAG: DUF1684 domain-containing protein [Saprospiraceae bacterium]|nr:DUF1684 domain-containing protein [Saprospiraceae bacterium]
MKILLPTIILLLSMSGRLTAQSFEDQNITYRENFKREMLEDARAPLQKEDLKYLQWFAPNEQYKVHCTYVPSENQQPIDVPTSSGRVKSFQEVGILSFAIQQSSCTLHVYRNMTLAHLPEMDQHLFLPFTDLTNGDQTYGGGRYIDLTREDVEKSDVWIDFNQAYNPWCAYSDGYNCPVPPRENELSIAILAGEKMYTGPHKTRGQ